MKFADDTTLTVEGISDVSIERRDDGHSLITNVLYIPRIKCNLLSISQLLEKGYKFHIENKALHVMDADEVLILKAHIAPNRTFKVELKVVEHRCITTIASREEWIWNYRLGHRNSEILMLCKGINW